MTFDSNMAATALRLITKRGKTVTFSKVTQLPYDPSTGSATTTTVDTAIKALVQDYSSAGLAFASGLILEGDKKISIAASSLTTMPVPGDKVTVGADTYTVKNVKTEFAGELAVLFEIRGRT